MARTRLTARKSTAGSANLPVMKLMRYKNYVRTRDHHLCTHVATMLQMWKEVKDVREGVTDYWACLKLISTLPPVWRIRARIMFRERVEFTTASQIPIISYPGFTAHLFGRLATWTDTMPGWMKEEEEKAMNEPEEELEPKNDPNDEMDSEDEEMPDLEEAGPSKEVEPEEDPEENPEEDPYMPEPEGESPAKPIKIEVE